MSLIGRAVSLYTALAALAAGAAAAQEQPCAVPFGVEDIFGPPRPADRIAAGTAVAAVPGAILARESLDIAQLTWLTSAPMPLPGFRFTYPAKARVTALRSPRGVERCLRDARRYGTGVGGRQIIPCLIDSDGDGRFEAADIVPTNVIIPYEGTRPQFRVMRRVELPAPVALEEDPEGLDHSRYRVHRRLRILSAAADSVTIVAEHVQASSETVPQEPPPEGTAPKPGAIAFQRVGAPRRVALADGATETIGGIRFRIARSPAGWSLTPLDPAFPSWIAYSCAGSTVRRRPPPL